MMGRTHVLGGAMAWVVIAPPIGVPWYGVAAGLPLAMAAALGPDIDHQKSALGRVVPWVAWPVSKVTTHRVQTHSLLSLLAVLLITRPLGPVPCAALTVGWAVHIVQDGLTSQGVAWFWPITREKTSLLGFCRLFVTIRTNGRSETVFTGIMCIGFSVYEMMRLML